MKRLPYLIIGALACVLFRHGCRGPEVRTERIIDTLIIRDTVRDTLLIPERSYIARWDTVLLPVRAISVSPASPAGGEVPARRPKFRGRPGVSRFDAGLLIAYGNGLGHGR